MAALSYHLLPVLVSAFFYRAAQAVPDVDRNRVLIAYNSAYDSCRGVDDSTEVTAKLAADEACEQAFEALDNIGLNTCRGWRKAQCRLMDGDLFRRCTCTISHCDQFSIRNNIYKTLQVCATRLWIQERATRVTPTPSAEFQQLRRKYNEIWNVARLQRIRLHPRLNAGSSSAAHSPGGSGTSGEWYLEYTLGEVGGPEESYRVYHSGEVGSSIASQSRPIDPLQEKTCHFCKWVFPSKSNYKNHMNSYHPGTLPPEPVGPKGGPVIREPGTGRFVCGECGNLYSSRRALRAHEASHKTNDTHCARCNLTYGTKSSYRKHMRKRHSAIYSIQAAAENLRKEEEKREVCEQCGKRFKAVRGLIEHLDVHRGTTTCDICGQVFGRLSNLYEHKRLRHPESDK